MTTTDMYLNERLDHLGIVAGICQEIGLAGWLDAHDSGNRQQVSVGTATVAMILCAGESVYGRNLAAFTPRDTILIGKARVRQKPVRDGRGICEPNCRWCRSSRRSQPL